MEPARIAKPPPFPSQLLLKKIKESSSLDLYEKARCQFATPANIIPEINSHSVRDSREVTQCLIPNKPCFCKHVDGTRIFNGQFSPEGKLYYESSQVEPMNKWQSSIKLYDTADPYNWKKLATIRAREISWTITDTDLFEGANGPSILYSSINPVLRLVNPLKSTVIPFDFSSSPLLRDMLSENGNYFGIWSVKFSGDGTEAIAGTTNGGLCIYNLEKSEMVNFARCHEDDVNTVCWDNRKSSHIVYTGSDDCMILVWDRRIIGEKQKPAGVLVGHQEGVTHISSKGDSHYLISNGKDQLLKVWDIRKMHKVSEIRHMEPLRRTRGFDYRYMEYPRRDRQARHPADCSVLEFSGHCVLATLIRCYFSPVETTSQRYIYTGSATGFVHIFDTLTGKQMQSLSIRDWTEPDPGNSESEDQSILPVRDVCWHPRFPLLVATSFDGCIYSWSFHPICSSQQSNIITE